MEQQTDEKINQQQSCDHTPLYYIERYRDGDLVYEEYRCEDCGVVITQVFQHKRTITQYDDGSEETEVAE